MKRPSQALAGRRVVAVIPCGCFRGVFRARRWPVERDASGGMGACVRRWPGRVSRGQACVYL